MLFIHFNVCYCFFFILQRIPIDSSNSQPVNNNTQHHRTNAEAQKNVSTETVAAAVIEKNVNQQNSARSSTLNSNAASFYAYPSNNNMHQHYSSYTHQPYYDQSFSSYDYCG